MKILLDECVHVELRNHIAGHEVFTVAYMKWKGTKNGALLARAIADGFEAFVTTDRGVAYEQHITATPLTVMVLHAKSNDLDDLLPLVAPLLTALNHAKPATVNNVLPP